MKIGSHRHFLQDIKCQSLQQLDTEIATDVITSQSL